MLPSDEDEKYIWNKLEHSDDDDDDKWIINCSWSKRVKQQYQMMKKMINERDVVSSQFFVIFLPQNISTVAKLRKWINTQKKCYFADRRETRRYFDCIKNTFYWIYQKKLSFINAKSSTWSSPYTIILLLFTMLIHSILIHYSSSLHCCCCCFYSSLTCYHTHIYKKVLFFFLARIGFTPLLLYQSFNYQVRLHSDSIPSQL